MKICHICTGSRRYTRIDPGGGYQFSDCPACVPGTYEDGAAVAFSIVGMFTAIRENAPLTDPLTPSERAPLPGPYKNRCLCPCPGTGDVCEKPLHHSGRHSYNDPWGDW